ncbi:MAG: hypothetical protein JSY10_24470 [Paenibacillus sp.]|nr:hypothetical protein [Paenibacillus sp.]
MKAFDLFEYRSIIMKEIGRGRELKKCPDVCPPEWIEMPTSFKVGLSLWG